jgi:adenosylhomocysteine nucleosidase
MRTEARPLLKLVGRYGTGRIDGLRTFVFSAGPHRCILVLSGMGLEPARKAARSLMAAESPQAILSFGIAGAIGGGIEVGDIVAGESCRMREKGNLGDSYPMALLSDAVHEAASAAAERRGARYFRGTVVTTRGLQSIHVALEGTAVVEMETAAIAQAAAERGIPLISFRAVSDSPAEPIPFVMPGGDEFHIKPFVLLGAILRNPKIIGPLLRMMRNSQRAAANLAEVVHAVLGLPMIL